MNDDDNSKPTTGDTNVKPRLTPAIEPSIPDWMFKVIDIKAKQSTVHQEQSELQKHTAENAIVDRIKKSDRLMILLTTIIACTGIAGAVITTCQTSVMRGQLEEMRAGSKDTKAIAEAAKQQAQDTGLLAGAAKNQATDTEKLAVATKDLAAAAGKQAGAAISQIGELKASVKAAITQSEVAKEANRISSSSVERGQRPWVAVGGIRIFNKPTEGEPIKINAKIVNGGKTPGVHAFVYHAFKLLITTEEYLSTHIPLRNEPEIEKCTQPKPKWTTALGGAIVLPGATNVSFSDESAKLPKGMIDLIAQKELPFNAVDFGEIRREGISPASTAAVIDLFFVGCIDYFDESNVAHRTYFYYMYNPFGTEFEPTGDFNSCINGNSAD